MPEIIAHRGASREFRENTLPAFRRALELGADAIELDVHGTADGVLVVHHDPVVTLPGAPAPAPLATLSAADVARVRLAGDTQIPTLDDVCRLVGDRATIYVEVKARAVESLVAAALDGHPACRMAVHAFDHRVPVAVRALRPATAIGLLSGSYPLDVAAVLAGSHADAFWQHAELVDEALVQSVHAAGSRLIAWTVNSTPHARMLAAWGVDGICTDLPGAIRDALG
jgi:glycerophosphoryl diester phosphodiesterase